MSRALTSLREGIEKDYSSAMIKTREKAYKLNSIPTGSLALDYALGTAGWPRGVIAMVYGDRDIGKSSLFGLNAMKNAQQMNLLPVYIMTEPGLHDMDDWDWLEANGVDTSEEKLLVLDPNNGEEAFELLHTVATSRAAENGEIGVILFDSIGSVISEGEMKDEAKMKMGGQSGLITFGLKRVQKSVQKNNICLILINQVRDNLNSPIAGVVKPAGPHILGHLSQIIIYAKQSGVTYKGKINGEDMTIGRRVVATVKRTKKRQGSDHKADIDHYIIGTNDHPLGLDQAFDVVTTGKRVGAIEEVSKSRFSILGSEPIYGMPAVGRYIAEHPELYEQIREKIVEVLLKKGEKVEVLDG